MQLEVHLDNIKDGNYTHQANKLAQRIESNRRAENMKPVIDQAVSTKKDIALFRSRGTAKVKNIVVNNPTHVLIVYLPSKLNCGGFDPKISNLFTMKEQLVPYSFFILVF